MRKKHVAIPPQKGGLPDDKNGKNNLDDRSIQKQRLAEEIQKIKQLEAVMLGKLNRQVSDKRSRFFKTNTNNDFSPSSSPSYTSLPSTADEKNKEERKSPMQLLSSVSTSILEEKQHEDHEGISSCSTSSQLLGMNSAVGGSIYIPDSTSHQELLAFNHKDYKSKQNQARLLQQSGCYDDPLTKKTALEYNLNHSNDTSRLDFLNARNRGDSGSRSSSSYTQEPSLLSSTSSWKTDVSPLSDSSTCTKKAIREIIDISNGIVKEEDNDAVKHIVKKCFRERIWPDIKFLTDDMIRDMELEQGEDESAIFENSVLGKLLRATKKEHYGYAERFRCWSSWSKYGQNELNTKKSNVTKQIKAEVLSGKNDFFLLMRKTIC